MSKEKSIAQPAHGGSFARDANGKLIVTNQTLPALTAQEVADGWVDVFVDGEHTDRVQKKPQPAAVAAVPPALPASAKK